jgi:uncharacterized protein YacL
MDFIILFLLVIVLIEVSYATYNLRNNQTKNNNDATFLDTSVLMDGRILPIVEAGFVPNKLVIPRSVIGELQLLADNSDHDRRVRARYGLDIAHKLRSLDYVEVSLFQDRMDIKMGVDDRLLALAKKYGGSICTIDYNLNKVAQVEGIRVLNINELAKGLRAAYLPGEIGSVDIVQKGQNNTQGVAYLPDGTMVVVDSASAYVGKSVAVEFTRSLQTDAGRMMFAKIHDKATQREPNQALAKVKPVGKRPINKKVQSGPRQATPVSSATKKSAETNHTQQNRRKTSKSNEEALLNLIDKQ